MWKWGAGVLAGLVILSAVAWEAGRRSVDLGPSQPESTMTPQRTPSPSPTPTFTPSQMGGVLTPQIIERERVTERSADDDDDGGQQPAPRVTVNVPRQQNPPTQPPPPTTRPPVEIPEIKVPKIPEPPNLDLPLLP